MKHGVYWDLVPDQLKDGEIVIEGSASETDAEIMAEEYIYEKGYSVEVRLLETLEHDLPVEDSNFSHDQIFKSERWCPVLKFTNVQITRN